MPGDIEPAIGLGCMRLSTEAERDAGRALDVVHAALDAGVTLLDTADAYALDDTDVGHGERIVAKALSGWAGDRSRVTVATKGGIRRPGGRWVPDGRAKHLRAACEASLRALGTDAIDLYQLHTVDPRTPLATSIRALDRLRRDGLVRSIGLCNVNVAQIEEARAITRIDAVQVSLSWFDVTNLRNGVAEYCRDRGIRLIAYRPLGARPDRMRGDAALSAVARAHDATPEEIALAWLLDLDPCVTPIPGATRVATARSIERVRSITLTPEDRDSLDAAMPAGRLLRVPRAERRPPRSADGDVVIVMGMPGAGKSTLARTWMDRGYERLNRDERGGRLRDLVVALDAGLTAGRRRWVLDNTYASRAARNEVIECAWRRGVRVRCAWLATSVGDAQINAIERLLDAHGSLPTVEELRALGRDDHRYFGPDAQFRYERQLEPPSVEEGFETVDTIPFERTRAEGDTPVLVLDLDTVCDEGAPVLDPLQIAPEAVWRTAVARWAQTGLVLVTAWRPMPHEDTQVRACFDRLAGRLEVPIASGWCPHPAGPPVCWCRKPVPGLVLAFAHDRPIDFGRSLVVGGSADRTMAERLGMRFAEPAVFLSST